MTGAAASPARPRALREAPLGPSPFADTHGAVVLALGYGIAALTWVAAGSSLPGGRWLAVHLFTLGVLTNLVIGFSQHFGRTLTRTVAKPSRWLLPIANVGILLVLVGLPTDRRAAVGAGASLVTAVVLAAYVRLRRMRKAALGARFAWVVRAYERAHSAFIHGAVLGFAMGVGALQGDAYAAARIAHLHINLLGWAGLTLLATIVFFGPTMARTRIVPGADDRAAVVLRHGAIGLSVAFWLLVASGVGGTAGTVVRLSAAGALAGYATAVTVVCLPVVVAARRGRQPANRWVVPAIGAWFPLVAWADVAVVATGRWRLLDAVGLAMLTGVLAQTVTAVLAYLTPMLRGRSFQARERLLARMDRAARTRTAAFNVGAVAVVVAALIGGAQGQALASGGWIAIAMVLAWLLGSGLLPAGGPPDGGPTDGRQVSPRL